MEWPWMRKTISYSSPTTAAFIKSPRCCGRQWTNPTKRSSQIELAFGIQQRHSRFRQESASFYYGLRSNREWGHRPASCHSRPQNSNELAHGNCLDPRSNELFVANDMGDSILVFDASASGDVAPIRVLTGPRTLIKNPTGVYVDTNNDELWVANFGNHTATAYKLTAAGDTAPLRTIRSAPAINRR